MPAGASAIALSVTVPDGAFLEEDLAFTIEASGVADGTARLVVKARPAAGGPCAGEPATDSGRVVLDQAVADGPSGGFGPLTASVVAPDPGGFLFCAWLVGPGGSVTGSQSTEVTIQPGAQILDLELAPWRPFRHARPRALRVERGVPVAVTVAVNNDLPGRFAYVKLARRACARYYAAQRGRVLLRGARLRFGPRGRPRLTEIALRRRHFDRGGRRWRVCAWVQEGRADRAPEDTAFQRITVARARTGTVARIVRAGGRTFLLAASRRGVPLDRGAVTFLRGARGISARPLRRLRARPYCARGRQLGLFAGVPAGATGVHYSGARSLLPSAGGVTRVRGLRKGRCPV
ncbi:MAG TPA: hypothetical protein VGF25_20235 [Thermoleophilaceae bacterium]